MPGNILLAFLLGQVLVVGMIRNIVAIPRRAKMHGPHLSICKKSSNQLLVRAMAWLHAEQAQPHVLYELNIKKQ